MKVSQFLGGEKLLNSRQVASIWPCDISAKAIDNYALNGYRGVILAHVPVCGKRMFRLEDVQKFLDDTAALDEEHEHG